jgi:predicted amidohydrolase
MYHFIKKTDARVILGEIKKKREKFFNVATYVDRDSTESYIKTHIHWTEHFAPGNELKVFRTPLGNVGVNICFDAAFPEVWRVLALKESNIIVNISAVPRTFPVKYMWRRMSAAAMNNQVFVIYANRAGDYFGGHSAVFNPRGDIVVNVEDEISVINTEIDLSESAEWREVEQIYPHRRPLLYRDIGQLHLKSAKNIALQEVEIG